MTEVSARPVTTKDMIIHAVADLNEKKGSNPIAIKKYLNDHYDLSQNRAMMITKLLRRAPDEGWLMQISGSGASSGSHFKLSPEMKKMLQKVVADKTKKDKEQQQQAKAKTRSSSETGNKRRTSKSAEKDAQAAKKKKTQPAKSPKEKAAPKKKTG